MKPREPIETGQQDKFGSRLDRIIDMNHGLMVVAGYVDWASLSEACERAWSDNPGHPALSTRLIAGLHILMFAGNHPDGEVIAMSRLSPYHRYFCGEEFFRHDLPLDRSPMTRWCQRMDGERVSALRKESLNIAPGMGVVDSSKFGGVVVNTMVQSRNIAHPRDARLFHRVREILARKAGAGGIRLRQSCTFVGEKVFRRCICFKRNRPARKDLGLLRQYPGLFVRDIGRRSTAIRIWWRLSGNHCGSSGASGPGVPAMERESIFMRCMSRRPNASARERCTAPGRSA